MPYKSLSALKTLCEASDWSISNLAANKLLYLANMFHLSESPESEPLVTESFEAWDYGPVLPSVYHSAKVFGNKPIRNIYRGRQMVPDDTLAADLLRQAAEFGRKKTPSQLVAITHWPDGAWARHYVPGARGITIPTLSIAEEAAKRAN